MATRRTPSGLIATDDQLLGVTLKGRPVVGLNQLTPLLLLIKRPLEVRAASVLPSAEDFMEYQSYTTRCTTGLELVEMSTSCTDYDKIKKVGTTCIHCLGPVKLHTIKTTYLT